MIIRLSSLRFCLWTAAAVGCALAVCSAQPADRQRGRSIEFSAPRTDEVTTNLHQLTNKKDGLKQLEEDLYQPLTSFAPRSSLDGVVAPPPRRPATTAIPSKQAKELLERRKNWIFMRPEDLLAQPTVEDILKTPQFDKNGREKQDVSTVEQYYQRLATKNPKANRPDKPKDEDLFGTTRKSISTDATGTHDDGNLPEGVKESAQKLQSLFGTDKSTDPSAQGPAHPSFADPFGLGGNTPSKEQVQEHKKYMDEYHSLVDPTWQPPAVTGPANQPVGFAAAAQFQKSPAAGFAVLPSTPAPHHGLDAQADVINPMLGPAPLPDVNARAVGQTRSAIALPKVESPKVIAPTFLAPKRTSL